MITKLFIMLIGYIFMIIGLTYIIIYFNLFTFGYTIKEYLVFILKSFQCNIFIMGFLIDVIILFTWKGNKK